MTDQELHALNAGLGLAVTILYCWRAGMLWRGWDKPEQLGRLGVGMMLCTCVYSALVRMARHEPYEPRHWFLLLSFGTLLAAQLWVLFVSLADARRAARGTRHASPSRPRAAGQLFVPRQRGNKRRHPAGHNGRNDP